jgi:predicted nucleic acid-binding protein
MTRIVADSSALILLAKCALLGSVCDQFEVIVPASVTAEVASEDLIGAYPDASLISDLILKGSIKVRGPRTSRFSLPVSLHKGERDALLLAASSTGSVFATDDGKAIKAARFLKVPFIITPKIVIELFRLQRISFHKAREALEKLSRIGRYSPEIIADALVSLMEERDAKANNHQNT